MRRVLMFLLIGLVSFTACESEEESEILIITPSEEYQKKKLEEYAFLLKWGTAGNDDGQFGYPVAIATDGSGNVYVADAGINHSMHRFTTDGVFVTKWGPFSAFAERAMEPTDIATDKLGNVYMADELHHCIRIFSPNGKLLEKWGEWGWEDGQFGVPESIAVDSADNVYVADKEYNSVQKFTSNGEFLAKWGGRLDNTFFDPYCVAVDKSDNVYVVDIYNRIKKYSPDGKFMGKWENPDKWQPIRSIAIDDAGKIYVAIKGRIEKITFSGKILAEWDATLPEDKGEALITDITVDGENLYLVDLTNCCIKKFAAK